jgi:hypothetical protein
MRACLSMDHECLNYLRTVGENCAQRQTSATGCLTEPASAYSVITILRRWSRNMSNEVPHPDTVRALDALAANIPGMWRDPLTFYDRFEIKAASILKGARLEDEDYVYARLQAMLRLAGVPPRPGM